VRYRLRRLLHSETAYTVAVISLGMLAVVLGIAVLFSFCSLLDHRRLLCASSGLLELGYPLRIACPCAARKGC
jgi:hypothetical protein